MTMDHSDRARGIDLSQPAHWWLDTSALPEQFWACLFEDVSGQTVVVDLDGARHHFADRNAAVAWLREDEYESLIELQQVGEVPAGLKPPTDFFRKSE